MQTDETRRGQQTADDRQAGRQADRRGCHVRALQNEWRGERGSLLASKPQPGAVRRSEDVHTWETEGEMEYACWWRREGEAGGRRMTGWPCVCRKHIHCKQ